MKKIFSLLLVIALLASMLAIAAEALSVEDAAYVSAGGKDTTVTIYGFGGEASVREFNVGESFTVYTTLKLDSTIGSINGNQSFTASVLESADIVDGYGSIENSTEMFPALGSSAMGRVTEGLITYNASTPYIGEKGFDFTGDNTVLVISHYTVTAAGSGEIRNALTTVAAADKALTRIVSRGVVTEGYTVGGAASFTDPAAEPETESPTEQGGTGKYVLGDVDSDGEATVIDATYIQRYATKLKVPFTEEVMMQGDVDGDGEPTVIDATYVQRYSTKLMVPYPIGEEVG